MSWLKIDDGFEQHEKVVDLSDAAHRLWFRCACWCSKTINEATGGFIPVTRVLEFCGGSSAKARKLSRELFEARGLPHYGHEHGLWEKAEGGWQFHHWADYRPRNLGEDEKEQLKLARSEAGKRGAAARWDGKGDGKPDGKVAIDSIANPIATPRQTGWQKNAPVSRVPCPVPEALGSSNEKLRGGQPGSARDDSWVPTPSETQFGATREELLTQPPPPSGVRKSEPPPAPSAPVPAKRNTFIAPHHQEDVIRAFGLWRDWAKQPTATLSYGDPRARLIQDRLDTYGPESFEVMLLGASKDDMVQGRKDGTEHKRLDYLLGNPSPARYEELLLAGSRLRAREQRKPARPAPRHVEPVEPEETPEERLAMIEELKRSLGAGEPTQREAVGE